MVFYSCEISDQVESMIDDPKPVVVVELRRSRCAQNGSIQYPSDALGGLSFKMVVLQGVGRGQHGHVDARRGHCVGLVRLAISNRDVSTACCRGGVHDRCTANFQVGPTVLMRRRLS